MNSAPYTDATLDKARRRGDNRCMNTKTPRAAKGTPTALNVWVLAQYFKDRDMAPARVEAVHAPHLIRCFKAGLMVAVDKATVKLTDSGRAAIAAMGAA